MLNVGLTDLKKFNYPDFVYQLIEDVVVLFVNGFSEKNIRAIVLHGSGSKGELTFKNSQIYSDLEFFIFVKKKPRADTVDMTRQKLARLKEKYLQNNPFFYIDFIIKPDRFLWFYQKNLLIYELKNTGQVLFGDQRILSELPAINLKNINLRAINDILLMRLMVFIRDFTFNPDKENDLYALIKNVYHYLAVVFLANNNILLPTAYARYQWLINHKTETKVLGQNFLDNYDFSARLKLSSYFPAPEFSAGKNYNTWSMEVAGHIFLVLVYLLNKQVRAKCYEHNIFAILEKAKSPFNDSFLNLYSLLTKYRFCKKGLAKKHYWYIFKIIKKPIRKWLVLSYLALMLSLIKYLKDEPCEEFLQLSLNYLGRIDYQRLEKAKIVDFESCFNEARKRLINLYHLVF